VPVVPSAKRSYPECGCVSLSANNPVTILSGRSSVVYERMLEQAV